MPCLEGSGGTNPTGVGRRRRASSTMPFPSATTKAAPEPAIDGTPRGVLLAVQFLARREMTLEPELLKLGLAAGLRLWQLGLRPLGLRQLGQRQ